MPMLPYAYKGIKLGKYAKDDKIADLCCHLLLVGA